MIFPISTDHNDGKKIGIVSIVIFAICILVQITISIDNHRVKNEVRGVIVAWETFNTMDSLTIVVRDQVSTIGQSVLTRQAKIDGDTSLEAMSGSAEFAAQTPQRKAQLAFSIDSVKQTALISRGGVSGEHPNPLALITQMFIINGFVPIIGMIFFFYVIGSVMEQYWGSKRFLSLYLSFGLITGLLYLVLSLLLGGKSNLSPMIGASGAIAGMMGALLAVCREIRIKVAYWIGIRSGILYLPLAFFIGIFCVTDFLYTVVIAKQSVLSCVVHLSGLVVGFLFGLRFKGKELRHYEPTPKKMAVAVAPVSGVSISEYFNEAHPHPESLGHITTPQNMMMEDAWHSFESKNYDSASLELVDGINRYLLDIVRYAEQIETEILKIHSVFKELKISSEIYHSWAMNCEMNGLKRPAWLSYEMAAQMSSKNVDYRMKMILKASEMRIDEGVEKREAMKFLLYVQQKDTTGRYTAEAQELIDRLT